MISTPCLKTELTVVVPTPVRLDLYLPSACPGKSRSEIQRVIKAGGVLLDGKTEFSTKRIVKGGESVTVLWPEEVRLEIDPENFQFKILFEDEDILVIDKPAGVVVHPAAGNWEGTVVNALLGKDASFAERFAAEEDSDEAGAKTALRPGIVHRLDKDTSGCLAIAKSPDVCKALSASFACRDVRKKYLALALGIPAQSHITLKTQIGRHPVDRKRMAVVESGGREAVSIVTLERKGVLETDPVSLVRVAILTGRTHQIRVHLSHVGLPILGDAVYGGRRAAPLAGRQMLHAAELEFPHPRTRLPILVTCPAPLDFMDIQQKTVWE